MSLRTWMLNIITFLSSLSIRSMMSMCFVFLDPKTGWNNNKHNLTAFVSCWGIWHIHTSATASGRQIWPTRPKLNCYFKNPSRLFKHRHAGQVFQRKGYHVTTFIVAAHLPAPEKPVSFSMFGLMFKITLMASLRAGETSKEGICYTHQQHRSAPVPRRRHTSHYFDAA